MEIHILKNVQETGQSAEKRATALPKAAVLEKDEARLMAATGQSQILFYDALLVKSTPWDKIEIFHLDEYCSLPETYPVSLRKHIHEHFVSHTTPKCVYYIDGMLNLNQTFSELNMVATEKPIDVSVIDFGKNVHIAFDDPPADFEYPDAYHIVTLEVRCKEQQVGEGWFTSIEDVPDQAVSASVPLIHSFQNIADLIPYQMKATAVGAVLETPGRDINILGAALLDHPNWFLYFGHESTPLLNLSKIKGW